MAKDDNIVILRFTKKVLKWQMMWPRKDAGIEFFMKFWSLTFLTIPFLIGTLTHFIIAIVENKNVPLEVESSVLISLCGMYYFLICYTVKVKTIVEEYEKLSVFDTFGKPEGFDKLNKTMDLFSKIYYVYANMILFVFCLAALVEANECYENNEKYNLDEVCGIIPTWAPFDINYSPMKEFVIVYQIFAARFTYTTVVITVFKIWEVVQHLLFRLDHLGKQFMKINEGKTYSERRALLNHALTYHIFLLDTTDTLSRSYSNCNFIHFFQSGAIIGTCGYQTIQNPHILPACLITGYTIALVIMSFAGQQLLDKCLAIGEIINRIDWYTMEMDIQKDLQFALLRSQKPIELRAGPFGSLSFMTIIMATKMAYTVLTLLNTVN